MYDNLIPVWEMEPDFEYTQSKSGWLRVRVTVECGHFKYKVFRKDMDALAPIQNIFNPGNCTMEIVATHPEGNELVELNKVVIKPQERIAVFLPDSRSTHIMVNCKEDGCQGTGIMECDDLPRV
jgi:hypothetical protein